MYSLSIMVYAIVNKAGEVVNTIEYDEKSDYNPGKGLKLVKIPEGKAVSIGWVYKDKKFQAPKSAE